MSHIPLPTAIRNADILTMRKSGLSFRKIANYHNLATWTVLQIARKEAEKAEWAKRSVRLQRECRVRKDLDINIPIDDLFCLLAYPASIRTALGRHFQKAGIEAYSLRDMMEFLIPKVRRSNARYYVLPACGIAGIGIKHCSTMIRCLSLLDCGEEFQKEWAARINLLKEYLDGAAEEWHVIGSTVIGSA